jgi:hypothetical protein
MNNRSIRIGVFILILFLISLAADSMGYATSINAGENLTFAGEPSIGGFWSILVSFYALVTFQITGVPPVLSFFVLILTIWLLLDIITWFKGE